MFRFRDYRFRYYNFWLVLLIIALCILGVLVIGSATDYDGREQKQLICFLVGLVLMLFLSVMDYHFILKFSWMIYLGNILLLLMVIVMGDSAGGAQRWVDIGGIRFQPSELAKICLILFFAKFFEKYQEKLNHISFLLATVVLFAVPLVLIYKQPALSTTIVTICILAAMLFLADLSWWYIGGVAAVTIPVISFALYKILQPGQTLIEEYQKNRMLGFLFADSTAEEVAKHGFDMNLINQINYQQKNSVMAIGSGQLLGKGLDNNTIASVKNGNFLSEPQTDFIFAIIGEELGFVGTVAVILLLLIVALECLWIAKNAKDMSGRLIAGGMAAHIAFQSFLNIGVATWILPNTGLPLPFISYGNTSLLSLMIGMGIVLNVSIQREWSFKEVLYRDD